MGGYVYALQLGAEGGFKELWKTKSTGRGIRPAPLVTDTFVITASREGKLDWLDVEDGSIVFTREVQAEVLSDILLIQPSETLEIAEPRIIISTTDHSRMLMAFTLNNGDNLWKYPN
jgi:outer membrane protein assembly factor BamB